MPRFYSTDATQPTDSVGLRIYTRMHLAYIGVCSFAPWPRTWWRAELGVDVLKNPESDQAGDLTRVWD